MKGRGLSVMFLCVFLLLSNKDATAQNPHSYEMREYFPLKVGNRWAYVGYSQEGKLMDGSEEVELAIDTCISDTIQLDGKMAFVFEAEEGRGPFFYYSLEDEGIKLDMMELSDKTVVFSPTLVYFPDTMLLGQEYNYETEARVYDSNKVLVEQGTTKRTITLNDIKDISVPAGDFKKCLEISTTTEFNTKAFFMITVENLYLAKGVGVIKSSKLIKKIAGEAYMMNDRQRLKSAVIAGNKIGM